MLKAIRLFFAKAYLLFCAVLHAILEPGFEKQERIMNILSYKYRDNDVFLVSFPKSGTTWMQMTLYQVFSDGEMDIDHIRNVIPYVEEGEIGQHKKLNRRVIASHLYYEDIPKTKAKYIYVMRDLDDVLVSLYYHSKNFGYEGTFDQHIEKYFKKKYKGGVWGKHLAGWLENKKNLDVHFVKYEDLKVDFPKQLDEILSFCEVELDEETKQRIIERSSMTYMKAHQEKFDQVQYILLEENYIQNNFLRKGEVGDGKNYLSDEQKTIAQKEKENYTLAVYQ